MGLFDLPHNLYTYSIDNPTALPFHMIKLWLVAEKQKGHKMRTQKVSRKQEKTSNKFKLK